ncbi:hypothetical protein EBR43_09365, partial [bacterium]|nr:hypothetical protein [bacterium]
MLQPKLNKWYQDAESMDIFKVVDLTEDSPHRVRQTAWGSWMSPSSPYIYNPKECVILAYK